MAVKDPNGSVTRGKARNRHGGRLISLEWGGKVAALETAFFALTASPREGLIEGL